MITIEQIKAARGLVNWTQTDLAKATGLSLPALNNLERKATLPRTSTLQLIETAFTRAGVEFLDNTGVRLRGEVFDIQKFEGKDFVDMHTQDILRQLKQNDFIYICSWDERKILKHAKDADTTYQKHMRDHKIDERIIVPDGDKFFISRPECYRWLPQSALGQLHWMVYGDKIAFYLWDKPYRALCITNPTLAGAYKKQFLFLWNLAKKPR